MQPLEREAGCVRAATLFACWRWRGQAWNTHKSRRPSSHNQKSARSLAGCWCSLGYKTRCEHEAAARFEINRAIPVANKAARAERVLDLFLFGQRVWWDSFSLSLSASCLLPAACMLRERASCTYTHALSSSPHLDRSSSHKKWGARMMKEKFNN